MQDLHPPFLPSATYHVYNHANGDVDIFREVDNYCYFNKKYDRRRSLFVPRVKRKQITNDAYFTRAIVYIHQNPVSHGFADDLVDWKHASYWGIFQGDDQVVAAKEVLGWFGGVEKYMKIHEVYVKRTSVFD